MTGLFATIEGIDGSGKTTVAREVARELAADGVPVTETREPTRTWRGSAVTWAIERDVEPVTESFLFLADRAEHTRAIRSWLREGALVLSDRYADSTYAYQGARLRERRSDAVRWLQALSAPYVEVPAVTYFLSVPPEVALARIGDRDGRSRYETPAFLANVDRVYRELARDPRFVMVDGTGTPDAVAGRVAADLRGRYSG